MESIAQQWELRNPIVSRKSLLKRKGNKYTHANVNANVNVNRTATTHHETRAGQNINCC